MFPRTIILGINMHGEIPINEHSEPFYGNLSIQNLIQINSVTCGVPNIANEESYNQITDEVSNYVDSLNVDWNTDMNPQQLLDYATNIKNILMNISKDELKYIQKEYRKNRQPNLGSYIHGFDKSFELKMCNHGEKLFNKRFIIFSEDEKNSYNLDEDSSINKIIVYNSPHKENILQVVESSLGISMNQITLFELIELFAGMGIQNIILVDMSCAVLYGQQGKLKNDRSIRAIRREIEKQKMGGKNKSIKKRSKKSRKTLRRK